jgi:hypothetical protein
VDQLHLHLHRFVGCAPEPFREIVRVVDVAGCADVVAGDEQRLVRAQPFVRDLRPGRTVNEQGVAAVAAVARGDERRACLPPPLDHALHGGGRELRAVCEHDDSGFHVWAERGQPTPERGAGAALPVRARDGTLELVRPRDDDDVFDSTESFENCGEEQALLRRAEPRRGSGREDDRRDQDA